MTGTGSSRSFVARPAVLREIRAFLRQPAADLLSRREAEDLILAASEASTNSVQHAGARRVHVAWRPVDRCLEVTITDDGVFGRAHVAEDRIGGFGMGMIRALADVVEIREGTPSRPGTFVRLIKCTG